MFYAIFKDFIEGIFLYSEGVTDLLVNSTYSQTLNEMEYTAVSFPDINDKGEIVFSGVLSGKSGIFKISDKNIVSLIAEGDSIPDIEPAFEYLFSYEAPSINNSGEISFKARLSDGRDGIFLFKDGIINPVLIEGDEFTVLDKSVTLISASTPVINNKGEIAFKGSFSTGSTKERPDEGIFLYRNGDIIPVKIPGQEAPGTDDIRVFSQSQFNNIALGNNSGVVYYGDYHSPGIEPSPDFLFSESEFGLFLWSETGTIPLALTGDPLPGTDGFVANSSDNRFMESTINDFGDICAVLAYDTTWGVFLFSQNKIVPVLLSKYPIPNIVRAFYPNTASINNQGDIVFSAIISEKLSNSSVNANAIFLAVKEDLPFVVTNIEPAKATRDSEVKIRITGTGFQPGAILSFSGNGIRTLGTKIDPLTASTTFTTKVRVSSMALPGFYDVIVTNPTGEEKVIKEGFRILRE